MLPAGHPPRHPREGGEPRGSPLAKWAKWIIITYEEERK
jgi:hypothetical protein